MHTLSRAEIRSLMARHDIRPAHGLGQNFLVDGNILRKIAGLLDLGGDDTVCEVGPGLGALTRELAAAAGRVVAVEKDARIIPALEEALNEARLFDMVNSDGGAASPDNGGALPANGAASPDTGGALTSNGATLPKHAGGNIEIVNADFLDYDLSAMPAGYKLTGNLPYYITTPVMMKAVESASMPSRMVFMMQKEVAERICAASGSRDYGAVSVAVQYRCRTELAMKVPAEVFMPKPRVDSAVIVLEPAPGHRGVPKDEDLFRKTVRAGFGQRRKMLRNALSPLAPDAAALGAAFERAGIEGTARAESLSVEQFISLSDAISDIIEK
ncbi:MAG: 16S rRNA (adenine(1518)-N(6)/adenine(1519)-N(6))-dimethyltransferase RsmA [Clostridiales Family XIII bacterium]|jgi:16S rRNA (adenine1518-N6/adenine1519-N6)-dimethyltransferase|nr:16S rRNA (adenine(1518)-N(6)/adenine(1519)-N(6))-dimethyltransferase RsmA [Clostridiales Family XIII bacterium]